MSEGKAIIIGTIMKIDKPAFRARHIYEMSSLSRQLIRHHLTALVKNGCLEKNDVWYTISDKDQLINEMIDTGLNKKEASKMTDEEMLDSEVVTQVNNSIIVYLACKALDLEGINLYKKFLVRKLDDAIDSLDKGKRYVNTGGMSPGSARKVLEKYSVAGLWAGLSSVLGEVISFDEFKEWFDNEMKVEEE